MGQVHVMTGVERRRRWSFDQKRAIVAAAFAPGAVVAEVARQADVSSGLIYRWRQELRASSAGFAEVVVSPAVVATTEATPSMIEVAAGDGVRVRLPVSVSVDLAAAVVKAVMGR